MESEYISVFKASASGPYPGLITVGGEGGGELIHVGEEIWSQTETFYYTFRKGIKLRKTDGVLFTVFQADQVIVSCKFSD
jgi:hypothetical protein